MSIPFVNAATAATPAEAMPLLLGMMNFAASRRSFVSIYTLAGNKFNGQVMAYDSLHLVMAKLNSKNEIMISMFTVVNIASVAFDSFDVSYEYWASVGLMPVASDNDIKP
jgi:sRNA-binding regulator protein Hfq